MIDPPPDCDISKLVCETSETLKAQGLPHWLLYPIEHGAYETVGRSYWCYQPNVDGKSNEAYRHHLALLCWGALNEIFISTKRGDGENLSFEEGIDIFKAFANEYNEYLKLLNTKDL